ncbi:MAG TPA: hypothetical protein VNU70_00865 [Puia sp.]|jgi:hypothetical protein|nr:hypothetical protein [Puia sp.]
MSTTIQSTVKGIDVNVRILSRPDNLNAAHAPKKAECFAKELPFYTCIDSVKDLWTKELGNGQVFLIKRNFDFVKDAPINSLIRELRQ